MRNRLQKVLMIGFVIMLLLMLLTKRRKLGKLVIAPLLLVVRKGMISDNMGAVFSDLK